MRLLIRGRTNASPQKSYKNVINFDVEYNRTPIGRLPLQPKHRSVANTCIQKRIFCLPSRRRVRFTLGALLEEVLALHPRLQPDWQARDRHRRLHREILSSLSNISESTEPCYEVIFYNMRLPLGVNLELGP
jgi:hypothetical protein